MGIRVEKKNTAILHHDRTFNPVDIFANVCGVVFGVVVWYALLVNNGRRRIQKVGG